MKIRLKPLIWLLGVALILGACSPGASNMGVNTSQYAHIPPNLDAGIRAFDSASSDGEYQLAMHHLLPFAQNGNADAQWRVGYMFDEAAGYPEDNGKGVYWYRLSAEQDHPHGQFLLGWMYDFGEGVPLDDAEGSRWYLMAAEQGHRTAQFYIGINYDIGEGVVVNKAEAVRWYQASAEQGHTGAAYNLAVTLQEGDGVPVDLAKALYWLERAAEEGHGRSMYMLGNTYRDGLGVPPDASIAIEFFFRAGQVFLEEGNLEYAQEALLSLQGMDPDHYYTLQLASMLQRY